MLFFFFILGTLFGSFINAAVYRLFENLPLAKARSMCIDCKHQLSALDLIPVFSFIFLKGKCRYCDKKISIQYPLVEIATGFLFLFFGMKVFDYALLQSGLMWLELLFFGFISLSLTSLFVFDYKYYLLPDIITLPSIFIVLVFQYLLGADLYSVGLGALIGGGFFLFQFLISKGKWIGGGDIRMGALMGVILGWKFLLVALFISYILGAAFGIILIFAGKKELGSKLPFGTFLAIGTIVTLFLGEQLLNWYLGFL